MKRHSFSSWVVQLAFWQASHPHGWSQRGRELESHVEVESQREKDRKVSGEKAREERPWAVGLMKSSNPSGQITHFLTSLPTITPPPPPPSPVDSHHHQSQLITIPEFTAPGTQSVCILSNSTCIRNVWTQDSETQWTMWWDCAEKLNMTKTFKATCLLDIPALWGWGGGGGVITIAPLSPEYVPVVVLTPIIGQVDPISSAMHDQMVTWWSSPVDPYEPAWCWKIDR